MLYSAPWSVFKGDTLRHSEPEGHSRESQTSVKSSLQRYANQPLHMSEYINSGVMSHLPLCQDGSWSLNYVFLCWTYVTHITVWVRVLFQWWSRQLSVKIIIHSVSTWFPKQLLDLNMFGIDAQTNNLLSLIIFICFMLVFQIRCKTRCLLHATKRSYIQNQIKYLDSIKLFCLKIAPYLLHSVLYYAYILYSLITMPPAKCCMLCLILYSHLTCCMFYSIFWNSFLPCSYHCSYPFVYLTTVAESLHKISYVPGLLVYAPIKNL